MNEMNDLFGVVMTSSSSSSSSPPEVIGTDRVDPARDNDEGFNPTALTDEPRDNHVLGWAREAMRKGEVMHRGLLM